MTKLLKNMPLMALTTNIVMNGMETIDTSKEKNKEKEKSNSLLDNIKSKVILGKLFGNIEKKEELKIVKYNKKIQNRLNLSLKDYKEYSNIVIEIIPEEYRCGKFINIIENFKGNFHIYFNNSSDEKRNKYRIEEEDKVEKIKIIVDYQVKSFKSLFEWCDCIKSINFKKFYRNNITNMRGMFYGCSKLKSLNLSKLNTINVTNMSHMFYRCELLEELNLSSFNTINVTNMSYMFYRCESLKSLNASSFNTKNVSHMSYIFFECKNLKKLEIPNFFY